MSKQNGRAILHEETANLLDEAFGLTGMKGLPPWLYTEASKQRNGHVTNCLEQLLTMINEGFTEEGAAAVGARVEEAVEARLCRDVPCLDEALDAEFADDLTEDDAQRELERSRRPDGSYPPKAVQRYMAANRRARRSLFMLGMSAQRAMYPGPRKPTLTAQYPKARERKAQVGNG